MEVLAWARDDRAERDLRRLLFRFALLRFDAVADSEGAASIYRRCRQAGFTPRGLIDCIIASVAVRNAVMVLSHDADFARLALAVGLELDHASLRFP
jgi:predicted nucleic acid-binding protein